jgi:hypothetical protein
MPHQTPHAPNAAAQNAATERQAPQDGAHADRRGDEPRAYAAASYEDATLAAPAAGEVGTFADEGDPSGGAQQGQDRRNRPETADHTPQGAKTRAANRRMAASGSPDQGTH